MTDRRPKRVYTEAQAQARAQAARSPGQRATRAAYARSERGKYIRFKTHLLGKYGISLEQWEALFEAQGARCARCDVAMTRPPQLTGRGGLSGSTDACVDHCHSTGRVRSLLCGPCNRRIGHLERPDGRHVKDMEYLERFKAKTQQERQSCTPDIG